MKSTQERTESAQQHSTPARGEPGPCGIPPLGEVTDLPPGVPWGKVGKGDPLRAPYTMGGFGDLVPEVKNERGLRQQQPLAHADQSADFLYKLLGWTHQ